MVPLTICNSWTTLHLQVSREALTISWKLTLYFPDGSEAVTPDFVPLYTWSVPCLRRETL